MALLLVRTNYFSIYALCDGYSLTSFDSAGFPYKRLSSNGYLMFLRKKSAETEYKAMANTTAELTTLLLELGYPPTQPDTLW
ncbi:hypothetical protein V6N12_045832 [Hibiscus sabdariffa]|uniref:Uncharacterized protein n=1 Tax=Hibiscus sabdariffa TaxID=183260 RepID=A0ABR2G470_9ROSI